MEWERKIVGDRDVYVYTCDYVAVEA